MSVGRPPTRPVFAKKTTIRFNDFSDGVNDKFSPLLLGDREVSDIQNMNYDQKGTLQKRKGSTRHYASAFGSGPVLGFTNYRKEDGSSRLVIVCDGKWLYDKPNYSQGYDLQADWDAAGVSKKFVESTAGEIQHARGQGGLGLFSLASRWASLGGPKLLREGIWNSQTIDITTVADKTTGTLTIGQTLPAGTTITFETRISNDGVTWDAWLALGGGSTIVATGMPKNFLQVRARFNSTGRARAILQSLIVRFDQTSTTTVLASGMSTSERWSFATQNDTLWGVNGADANRKWDGTTFATQSGTPPTCQCIIVHKNYMFLAGNSATNRSRLYFSDLGLPESWPALNFIDVGKGDGDAITGLFTFNDQLIIFKDHSTWVLQGDAPTNFTLRKATDEAGAISGKSVVVARNAVGQLDRNGFFFFDGVRAVIASEKVENKLKGMNQRQLQKVASIVFQKKIWIALPEGGPTQLYNNCILVFDTLRTAWTVYRGINASEFVIWRQQNQDTLLCGSSTTGQVYDLETATYNDDGVAIDAYVVTKAVDFGAAELLSLIRRVLITGMDPLGGTVTAAVSFFQNLGIETTTQTATFDKSLNVLTAYPGKVGIGQAHTLAVKIRNNVLNQGINIDSIAFEYVRKGVRATG